MIEDRSVGLVWMFYEWQRHFHQVLKIDERSVIGGFKALERITSTKMTRETTEVRMGFHRDSWFSPEIENSRKFKSPSFQPVIEGKEGIQYIGFAVAENFFPYYWICKPPLRKFSDRAADLSHISFHHPPEEELKTLAEGIPLFSSLSTHQDDIRFFILHDRNSK